MRKTALTKIVVGTLMAVVTAGRADVFNMDAGLMSLETVPVGDAGNAAYTGSYGSVGSVAYKYNIGRCEITAAQYCDFLNKVATTGDPYGLYNQSMWGDTYGCKIQQTYIPGVGYGYTVGLGYANRPVNYVSFWDACRFANWLSNGQPAGPEGPGTTETGTYALTVDGMNNNTVVRNAGWTWAVTSEDEWMKAACYRGGGLNAGYWTYATGSSSRNSAAANWSGVPTTNVGTYNFPSPYGTFDQAGNVVEWTEAIHSGSYRVVHDSGLGSGTNRLPDFENLYQGFRVSQIPEPLSMAFLVVGLTGVLARRK